MQLIKHELELIIQHQLDSRDTKCYSSVGHYFYELRRIGLWPMPDAFSEANLKHLVTKLRGAKSCTLHNCYCYTLNLSERLSQFAGSLESNLRGMCLHCVKEGRMSSAQKNCMAFVAADCSTPRASLSVPHFFPIGGKN